MSKFSPSRTALQAAFALSSLAAASQALAYDWGDGLSLAKKEGDQYALLVSPLTQHFHPSPEHKHVWLVGVERKREDHSLAGAAFFSNSFGQHSAYLFPWGQTYHDLLGKEHLYVKWTAGLLYGYREPYENKVPFNYHGFSPAIVPAVGWQFDNRYTVQLNLLGLNGAMLQFSLPVR
ncbi:MAG: hypothetical protein RL404_1756 [Pseudomonadota bacterium]|jgi:hypothetical protein